MKNLMSLLGLGGSQDADRQANAAPSTALARVTAAPPAKVTASAPAPSPVVIEAQVVETRVDPAAVESAPRATPQELTLNAFLSDGEIPSTSQGIRYLAEAARDMVYIARRDARLESNQHAMLRWTSLLWLLHRTMPEVIRQEEQRYQDTRNRVAVIERVERHMDPSYPVDFKGAGSSTSEFHAALLKTYRRLLALRNSHRANQTEVDNCFSTCVDLCSQAKVNLRFPAN